MCLVMIPTAIQPPNHHTQFLVYNNQSSYSMKIEDGNLSYIKWANEQRRTQIIIHNQSYY